MRLYIHSQFVSQSYIIDTHKYIKIYIFYIRYKNYSYLTLILYEIPFGKTNFPEIILW